MEHYIEIYNHHADIYHSMIKSEDFQGNLLPALEHVTDLGIKRILDVGSGTGRIPLLLGSQVGQIIALDLHWGMLLEQKFQRDQKNGNWGLLQGDLRVLPFIENHFDVVTAGWAIGHFQSWFSADWYAQVDCAINEMFRTIKPGGVLIIIETLTTGSTVPAPPTERLGAYYTWLEDQWGFSRQQISTDYLFQDLEEAVELTKFFFGDELSSKVRKNNWVQVPEWTGVWAKIKGSE